MRCGSCGRENRTDARFCDSCGAQVSAAAVAEPEAERRQITVLFCDLVDSVALSTGMDPEDFGSLMQAYEAAGQEAVGRFGGHVAQYLGDGLVVYFGYPQAHERAAELAVHAGLALLDAVTTIEHASARDLAVRVGVHTGEVVVQSMGRGERRDSLALGDVVNIAARAQSLTTPGTVAITGTTFRLVADGFAVDSMGFPAIKGVDRPLELLRVLGPAEVGDVAIARHRSPFVGRASELGVLRDLWADVAAGRGQVVRITGEPGIGKSRLVDEFRRGIAEDHLWLECRGGLHTRHTAFASVGAMIQQAFGWKPDVTSAQRLDDLDAGLADAGIDIARIAPLVAGLLGLVPGPDRYPGETRTAERQREELQDAMITWLLAVARTQPLVVVTEDRQWLDPSSLELLDRMNDAITDARVLMLQTERIDAVDEGRPAGREIRLHRLDSQEVDELVGRLAAPNDDAGLLAQLAARAEGVPLFLEEVMRASGDDAEVGAVPSTLRDALAARLDRLGPARAIAQTAAVLGTEFSVPLLRTVSGLDETEFAAALEQLIAHEIAEPMVDGWSDSYRFTHALLQETAYTSLLRSRRQELHAVAADAMTGAEGIEFPPEMIAVHLTGAGRARDAIAAWEQASRAAFSASALSESEAHVRRALELVDQLSEAEDPIGVEMELQMQLGRVASATHGMASGVVRDSYARAIELGEALGERPRLVGMLFGAWGGAFSHGDVGEARRHVDALERAWAADPDPAMVGWVRYAQATTSFAQGDLRRADELLTEIFGSASGATAEYGLELTTVALTHRLLTDAHLGRLDTAVATAAGFRSATESGSPFEHGMTLMASCCLFIQLGDVAATEEFAHRLHALGTEAGLPTFVAWADLYLGWVLTRGGDPEQGLHALRRGLAAYLATDQRTGQPGYLGWVAAAQCAAGRPGEAMQTIIEAEAALPEERNHAPVLLVTRGEVLEHDPDVGRLGESAELCYQQAVAAARAFGSVAYELVASLRLARLLAAQGDGDAPKRLLAPLLPRFEGGAWMTDFVAATAAVEGDPGRD